MSVEYPKATDSYPVLYLKDTDAPLSSSAVFNPTRYAYFKTIARGGTCIIQSCKDFYFNRVICYKTLKAEFAEDKYAQQRLLREARVTASLQHPNTVPVYDLGKDKKGHYYFTMKLVQGLTLREILEEVRNRDERALEKYPLGYLIEVLIQICNAIDYAHRHGVIHRDIKPSNILIGPFGEVLVLDWGLAKVWDMKEELPVAVVASSSAKVNPSLTSQGSLQATPLYMSPEQIKNSADVDHRSDIYNIGSVLYEILTLDHMAWGESINEMLDNTQNVMPQKPSDRCPDRNIPVALEEICMRCIPKEPQQRIQQVAEVIAELKDWREESGWVIR